MLQGRIIFLWLLLNAIPALGAANEWKPSPRDENARQELILSVRQAGALSKAFSFTVWALGHVVSPLVPNCVLEAVDKVGAYGLEKLLSYDAVRQRVMGLAFGRDAVSKHYAESFGVYRTLPEQALAEAKLLNLIAGAEQERETWQGGSMSGAVYDGSRAHMASLAQHFEQSYGHDPLNREVLTNKPAALHLAHLAYEAFHTSNPLHGHNFPLSVKAMGELGSMLAQFVGGQYGLISSGGREALRIGLRALKLAPQNGPVSRVLLVDDKVGLLAQVAKTLHLQTTPVSGRDLIKYDVTQHDVMVINLDRDNAAQLSALCALATKEGLPIHVHLNNDLLRRMLSADDLDELSSIFKISPAIASASFDTAGLVFAGVSATVFARSYARFQALEAHIGWTGGIYPGLNTSGSLAGSDYIVAYLLLLHEGRVGLRELARLHESHPMADRLADDLRQHPVDMNEKLGQAFWASDEKADVGSYFAEAKQAASVTPQVWRNDLEQRLVELTLAIFDASPADFLGRITAGGTESIRLAIQHYAESFWQRHPGRQPIFLMSEMAHIAFDRHMIDTDSIIVRLANDERGGIDLADLQAKIEQYGAEQIAAIVASVPSYPLGVADDIEDIAVVAARSGVALHVDACLGAFVMQFVAENPLRLSFSDPRWDGVSSWSADLHKYGVTHKGLSFVGLRRSATHHQTPALSHTITMPRSVGSLELGLHCLLQMGGAGYQQRAASIVELGRRLRDQLASIQEIELVGRPREKNHPHWVVAFRLKEPLRAQTYTLAKLMERLGWHLSQVGDYTLHMALTSSHCQRAEFIAKFASDLSFVSTLIAKHPQMKQGSSVGTYGMAVDLPKFTLGRRTKAAWLKSLLRLYGESIVGVTPGS